MSKISGIEFRPVIIPKAVYDLLLKQKEPLGLIGLYNFYYYTAIWQGTNQPKATVGYIVNGLKISATRVRRYKKVLVELGLIKEVIKRDKQHKIVGHFIKVQYLVSTLTSKHTVAFSEGNALNNNNKTRSAKAASRKRKPGFAKKRKTLLPKDKKLSDFDEKCAVKLANALIRANKIMRKIDLAKWEMAFAKFRRDTATEKREIKKVLKWYCSHIGGEFIPVAYAARTFCTKFVQIQDEMLREAKKREKRKSRVKRTKKGNKEVIKIVYSD